MRDAIIKSDICKYGILLCGGYGTRTTLPYNKILHYVGNKTVFELSLDLLINASVDNIVIVCKQQDIDIIKKILVSYKDITTTLVIGGDTRTQSSINGLTAIKDYNDSDIVVIHDCARPFASVATTIDTINSAILYDSGISASGTTDTIATVREGYITSTLDRATLYNISTPQSFNLCKIKLAYSIVSKNITFTDDASVYSAAGFSPKIVLDNRENKKITTINDIYNLSNCHSIGVGFDVHKLVPNRKLILGGVTIPYNLGLLGHSDADVLTHAIIDALLSSENLSDIGVQFSDTNPSYKDINSLFLLKSCMDMLKHKIHYISGVIIAQKPKLAGYISDIESSLANAMQISNTQIKISSTTSEQLGIIGKSKAIAASAVALMKY